MNIISLLLLLVMMLCRTVFDVLLKSRVFSERAQLHG